VSDPTALFRIISWRWKTENHPCPLPVGRRPYSGHLCR